jgi:hypothetical protein
MMTHETLLNEINRFLERHDMAPSTFGRLFLNNPGFISDLSQDKVSPTLKTVNKIQTRMKNYKAQKGKKDGE